MATRPDPPLSNRRVGICHHAPWLAGRRDQL